VVETQTSGMDEKPMVFRRMRLFLIGRPLWILVFAVVHLPAIVLTLVIIGAAVFGYFADRPITSAARATCVALFALDILLAFPLAIFIVGKVEVGSSYCRERTIWRVRTVRWDSGVRIGPRDDSVTGPIDFIDGAGRRIFRLRPLRYARPYELAEAVKRVCPHA